MTITVETIVLFWIAAIAALIASVSIVTFAVDYCVRARLERPIVPALPVARLLSLKRQEGSRPLRAGVRITRGL